MRMLLLSWCLIPFAVGCGDASKQTSDTSDSMGACPADYDEVECCDFESGEISTCCCYQEDCEEVGEFTRTDDGGCTEAASD